MRPLNLDKCKAGETSYCTLRTECQRGGLSLNAEKQGGGVENSYLEKQKTRPLDTLPRHFPASRSSDRFSLFTHDAERSAWQKQCQWIIHRLPAGTR
ncbi:hypothetical protein AVEN_107763-1 [Araneus ventricosus]|uniref:Uncharacterized protein n=1 Tax=Araneus ventricosus TaxID=182803 RepID=A0A4Y2SHM4_ARAVE|nr:hypothetical protein AVEN_107763-1 [Araneus ventricosus]